MRINLNIKSKYQLKSLIKAFGLSVVIAQINFEFEEGNGKPLNHLMNDYSQEIVNVFIENEHLRIIPFLENSTVFLTHAHLFELWCYMLDVYKTLPFEEQPKAIAFLVLAIAKYYVNNTLEPDNFFAQVFQAEKNILIRELPYEVTNIWFNIYTVAFKTTSALNFENTTIPVLLNPKVIHRTSFEDYITNFLKGFAPCSVKNRCYEFENIEHFELCQNKIREYEKIEAERLKTVASVWLDTKYHQGLPKGVSLTIVDFRIENSKLTKKKGYPWGNIFYTLKTDEISFEIELPLDFFDLGYTQATKAIHKSIKTNYNKTIRMNTPIILNKLDL